MPNEVKGRKWDDAQQPEFNSICPFLCHNGEGIAQPIYKVLYRFVLHSDAKITVVVCVNVRSPCLAERFNERKRLGSARDFLTTLFRSPSGTMSGRHILRFHILFFTGPAEMSKFVFRYGDYGV